MKTEIGILLKPWLRLNDWMPFEFHFTQSYSQMHRIYNKYQN